MGCDAGVALMQASPEGPSFAWDAAGRLVKICRCHAAMQHKKLVAVLSAMILLI
jgi:hypothetical protein